MVLVRTHTHLERLPRDVHKPRAAERTERARRAEEGRQQVFLVCSAKHIPGSRRGTAPQLGPPGLWKLNPVALLNKSISFMRRTVPVLWFALAITRGSSRQRHSSAPAEKPTPAPAEKPTPRSPPRARADRTAELAVVGDRRAERVGYALGHGPRREGRAYCPFRRGNSFSRVDAALHAECL